MGKHAGRRSELETISPNQAESSLKHKPQVRVFIKKCGAERIYVAKQGTFGAIILLILVVGIFSLVMLFLLLGIFFIWLPLVIMLVMAAIVFALLGAFSQRGS